MNKSTIINIYDHVTHWLLSCSIFEKTFPKPCTLCILQLDTVLYNTTTRNTTYHTVLTDQTDQFQNFYFVKTTVDKNKHNEWQFRAETISVYRLSNTFTTPAPYTTAILTPYKVHNPGSDRACELGLSV